MMPYTVVVRVHDDDNNDSGVSIFQVNAWSPKEAKTEAETLCIASYRDRLSDDDDDEPDMDGMSFEAHTVFEGHPKMW